MTTIRRLYGDGPLHLLVLLFCFALAAYAALRLADALPGSAVVRVVVWFVAAGVVHDLLLFPLYALADRSAAALFSRGRRREAARRIGGTGVNYLRVPALLSGLLFLLFAPLILRRSEPAYGAASGLTESPFLARWFLLSALLFLISAVFLAVRVGRRRAAEAAAIPAA